MSKLKTQIGESLTADFEEQTWTFEMDENFNITSGEFAIIPKEDYDKLFQILINLLSVENNAFGSESFDVDRFKEKLNEAISVVF